MSVQDVERAAEDARMALARERHTVSRLGGTVIESLHTATDTAMETVAVIARDAVAENERLRLTVAEWYRVHAWPTTPAALRPPWWVRLWERLTGLDAGGRWT